MNEPLPCHMVAIEALLKECRYEPVRANALLARRQIKAGKLDTAIEALERSRQWYEREKVATLTNNALGKCIEANKAAHNKENNNDISVR